MAEPLMQSRDTIQVDAESAMHRGITDHEVVRIASKQNNRTHLQVPGPETV